MVDIQNATLAGGVAIGSCSDMVRVALIQPIGPAGALTIGTVAGLVSTFGFSRLQTRVERSLGIHDTWLALFLTLVVFSIFTDFQP